MDQFRSTPDCQPDLDNPDIPDWKNENTSRREVADALGHYRVWRQTLDSLRNLSCFHLKDLLQGQRYDLITSLGFSLSGIDPMAADFFIKGLESRKQYKNAARIAQKMGRSDLVKMFYLLQSGEIAYHMTQKVIQHPDFIDDDHEDTYIDLGQILALFPVMQSPFVQKQINTLDRNGHAYALGPVAAATGDMRLLIKAITGLKSRNRLIEAYHLFFLVRETHPRFEPEPDPELLTELVSLFPDFDPDEFDSAGREDQSLRQESREIRILSLAEQDRMKKQIWDYCFRHRYADAARLIDADLIAADPEYCLQLITYLVEHKRDLSSAAQLAGQMVADFPNLAGLVLDLIREYHYFEAVDLAIKAGYFSPAWQIISVCSDDHFIGLSSHDRTEMVSRLASLHPEKAPEMLKHFMQEPHRIPEVLAIIRAAGLKDQEKLVSIVGSCMVQNYYTLELIDLAFETRDPQLIIRALHGYISQSRSGRDLKKMTSYFQNLAGLLRSFACEKWERVLSPAQIRRYTDLALAYGDRAILTGIKGYLEETLFTAMGRGYPVVEERRMLEDLLGEVLSGLRSG